jgi:hypothetical protein
MTIRIENILERLGPTLLCSSNYRGGIVENLQIVMVIERYRRIL